MIRILLCLCLLYPAISSNAAIYIYGNQSKSQLKLAFVGDILLHQPLRKQSEKKGIAYLWQPVQPYLDQADILIGNLEGAIAKGVDIRGRTHPRRSNWDSSIYTGYPQFNYPPQLAKALADSGFTILTTANNHSLDRYAIGVDKTITILQQHNLTHIGTKHSKLKHSPWYTITHQHRISIAWIACTTSTNGIPDNQQQVLRCYQPTARNTILNLVKSLKNKVDAIIILPHWGKEYQFQPTLQQRSFAQDMLNAGAIAVIGNHPHVLQPVKIYHLNKHRQGVVAYSLGNFISNQGSISNRTSIILYIDLAKKWGKTRIKAVSYQPVFMQNRSGAGKIQLVPIQSRNTHLKSWGILHRVFNSQ
jgi:poly-gamma-glutamate capsule biosynthesis protein CapA/YwtB (metallophosphatase superfamily)